MSSYLRRSVVSAALLLLIITFITFPLTRHAATQTAAPGCAQVPAGIVSWYPGELGVEGNAEDVSGNNDGTELGGVTHPPGKVGNAFGLDGVDDQIEVPDNATLDLNTLTIDAWINRSSTADARIVDKITAGGADGYLLDILDNRLRLIIGGATVVGTTPIETGTFTLVAGTFDGTNLRVYVNGALDGTTTVESTTTPTNTLPLHIGTNSAADGSFFAGVIDELELFNRALTQEEIQSLVNADSTGKCRPPGSGQLIISEFRFRGPGATRELPPLARAGSSRPGGGARKPSAIQDSNTDEFIEIYNNSDSDISVATIDGSAGWALAYGSDPVVAAAHAVAAVAAVQTLVVIENGTIIPARSHLLVANSLGYSLGGYPAGPGSSATPDLTYTNDIPDDAGVALFSTANQANFSFRTRLDAAGFASPQQQQVLGGGGKRRPAVLNSLFYEDTPIQNHVSTNEEHSFIRKPDSGRPRDTDNNASDFQLIATDPTLLTGATLGAPGPENSTSPIQRSLSLLKSTLVDPCAASSQPPNRVRDFTSDPANNSTSGTLLLRRRFTNTTDRPVTRLRFRVVDLTTLSNPASPDGVADLRAISSGVTPVTVSGAGCTESGATIDVQGLTLEEPPAQPNGGGLNSTLSTGMVSLDTPLAATASIDLNFLFGVERPGTFRAFVIVEATFDTQPLQNFQTSRAKQKGVVTGEGSSPQVRPKAHPRSKH
jgi:hypothetical protein